MTTFTEMAEQWIRVNMRVSIQKQARWEPGRPPLSASSVGPVTASEESVGKCIPPHDPAEWRKPFAQWLDSACLRHPRAFGGVRALHVDYCEWEIAKGGVPCTLETFLRLLEEHDFVVGEICGTLLVAGLAFLDDVGEPGSLLQ